MASDMKSMDKPVESEEDLLSEDIYQHDLSYNHQPLDTNGNKILRRPLIASVSLFTTLNLILTILLYVFSQSNYNAAVYFTYTFIDFFIGIVVCITEYSHNDFMFLTDLSFCRLFSCCGAEGASVVLTWRIRKAWLFFGVFLCWLRALGLFLSITGQTSFLGISLIGHNSCTSSTSDALSVFHPNGIFPFNGLARYEATGLYTFCTLDGRWEYPDIDNQFVRGYKRLPDSNTDLNCAIEQNPGYVAQGNKNPYSTDINYKLCEDAYPNSAYGTPGPVITGTLNLTTSLCPGNSNAPVCYTDTGEPFTCTTLSNTINYRHSVGLPVKLCSFCLNYWRRKSGQFEGPVDYEHCTPYSDTQGADPLCELCPGRGDGGWLTDEKYSKDDLILAFWLATAIAIFNPFLELLFFAALWNKTTEDNIASITYEKKDE